MLLMWGSAGNIECGEMGLEFTSGYCSGHGVGDDESSGLYSGAQVTLIISVQ